MARNPRKILSLVLAMLLCMGMFSGVAMADTWKGDGKSATVTKGTNGYTFQSVYQNPGHAYEMSGHMVSVNGAANNDIPQILVLVPADRDYTFTPAGQYVPGTNYEVLYCCDAKTGYETGIHYKRMNLEDSNYYDAADADKIRAIVSISYPFKTEEQMKSILRSKGFKDADKLTRGEIISAVQSAIWYFANNQKYSYSQTFNVADNSQWGSVMNEYGWEGYNGETWMPSGKRKFATNEEVGNRINDLRDFLINLPGVDAKAGQIVITKLEVLDSAPQQNKNGVYTVTLKGQLNTTPNKKKDDVTLTVYVNGKPVMTKKDFQKDEFKLSVEVKNGDVIKAEVSGTQMLNTGVYFYEPEGGRDVSQCLVGVANGPTAIYASKEITITGVPEEKPEEPEEYPGFHFPKGGASNISYMLINPDTQKVEFVKKIDLEDGDTTAPIITKEGYISAMFIKQSTSGKFWIAEEVDEAIVQEVIKCLIANNPSYKGHDEEIAFGYGTHTLTYSKNKGKTHTVTYNFVAP